MPQLGAHSAPEFSHSQSLPHLQASFSFSLSTSASLWQADTWQINLCAVTPSTFHFSHLEDLFHSRHNRTSKMMWYSFMFKYWGFRWKVQEVDVISHFLPYYWPLILRKEETWRWRNWVRHEWEWPYLMSPSILQDESWPGGMTESALKSRGPATSIPMHRT